MNYKKQSPLEGRCAGSPAKQMGSLLGASIAAGNSIQQQQPMVPPMVQPMTNVTPAPSAMANTFSPTAQANMQGIFGSNAQRQMSVNAPFMYKDGSPLEGNAFIGAKIAAEKAGKDTFEVGGKTFQVK